MNLGIREIGSAEFGLIWPIFHEVVAAGDTYLYSPDITFEDARSIWLPPRARAFVAEADGKVFGHYMLKPNAPGLGDHVANAGYMVAPSLRGHGIASRLCEHSIETARAAGFSAMQFNAVVSSNEVAVRLWQKHGFTIVGMVPKAFRHAQLGPTDIYIMHRFV